MKSVMKFIKELLFPNTGKTTPIGLSQFKYAKEEIRMIQKTKNREVSLTELMRKTAN